MPVVIVQDLPPPTVGGYFVEGNRTLDANGQVHTFRGVNRPSFEWVATGQTPVEAVYQAIKGRGANVVRLPLNQTFWMNDELGYRTNYDQQIEFAKKWGLDVIADLHWHDVVSEQEPMARTDALDFWVAFATRYGSDSRILFELYNEPHDVSPDEWRSGGNGWAGMQQMHDAVRSTGAPNITIITGLRFGFDLVDVGSGFTGDNIVYSSHVYDFGDKQPNTWDVAFGNLASSFPLILTEFGTDNGSCAANWENQVLDYAEARGMGWVAWAWFPGDCGFPSLVQDWAGTTLTEKGTAIFNRLAAFQ